MKLNFVSIFFSLSCVSDSSILIRDFCVYVSCMSCVISSEGRFVLDFFVVAAHHLIQTNAHTPEKPSRKGSIILLFFFLSFFSFHRCASGVQCINVVFGCTDHTNDETYFIFLFFGWKFHFLWFIFFLSLSLSGWIYVLYLIFE